MHIADPAFVPGSTVVVIGANGYMAVEVCDKLLQAGYNVRGTVRDVKKHQERLHKIFDDRWSARFELVEVKDFEAPGSFDTAFKGATGVILVSVPTIFDPNPEKVVDPLIKGIINSLTAAAAAGVQRYVLNSSSKATDSADYSRPRRKLTVDTFNQQAIKDMRQGSVDDTSFARIVTVYSAARALSELAFWDWVKTNNPPFVANCVVPDGQFGRVVDRYPVEHGISSNGQLNSALLGNWSAIGLPLAFWTDVQDSATLMVAALTFKSIRNERIFSYHTSSSWNQMRVKVRELFPNRPELVQGEDQELDGHDLAIAPKPVARAEEILRETGQSGFRSDDDVLRDFVADMFGSGPGEGLEGPVD